MPKSPKILEVRKLANFGKTPRICNYRKFVILPVAKTRIVERGNMATSNPFIAVRDKLPANTYQRHISTWGTFNAWCKNEGFVALPVDPTVYGWYLEHLANNNYAYDSALAIRAVISYAHKVNGFVDPTNLIDDSDLALNPHDANTSGIRLVLQHMPGTGLVSLRDQALLLLGLMGDICAEDIQVLDVEDIQFIEDSPNAWLRIRRHQREDRLEMLSGEPKDLDICPVTALKSWLHITGIETGPVFRAVQDDTILPDRLNRSSINHILKHFCENVGLDAAVLRGHPSRSRQLNRALEDNLDVAQVLKTSETHCAQLKAQLAQAETVIAELRAHIEAMQCVLTFE